jgi:predicted nuclease of restriction endonuclease-like (RecB) superfamily
MSLSSLNHNYIVEIKEILSNARKKAYTAVNTAMVEAYWHIGKRIVEEEQQGKERAAYGKEILKKLSDELTNEFGKGFSQRTLREFRQFYFAFLYLYNDENNSMQKWRTVFAKLSWSHFQKVLKVSSKEAQHWYLKEASEQNWSVRTLDRNISTLFYHRLLSSQEKESIQSEMHQRTSDFQQDSFEFIKNPAVLEFLNLPINLGYTEHELEKALINNLQKFILELGKGYAFVDRQHLIRTETSDFYIDLVFYNYILKCFVLIELKTTKLNHQDIGQLDMYVRMYDDIKKQDSDNPTIGILLCTETDHTIAKYSILSDKDQLFASKYMPYLPTESELIAEIERERLYFYNQQ